MKYTELPHKPPSLRGRTIIRARPSGPRKVQGKERSLNASVEHDHGRLSLSLSAATPWASACKEARPTITAAERSGKGTPPLTPQLEARIGTERGRGAGRGGWELGVLAGTPEGELRAPLSPSSSLLLPPRLLPAATD
eukprot:3065139-Rhodomonas_salina.1